MFQARWSGKRGKCWISKSEESEPWVPQKAHRWAPAVQYGRTSIGYSKPLGKTCCASLSHCHCHAIACRSAWHSSFACRASGKRWCVLPTPQSFLRRHTWSQHHHRSHFKTRLIRTPCLTGFGITGRTGRCSGETRLPLSAWLLVSGLFPLASRSHVYGAMPAPAVRWLQGHFGLSWYPGVDILRASVRTYRQVLAHACTTPLHANRHGQPKCGGVNANHRVRHLHPWRSTQLSPSCQVNPLTLVSFCKEFVAMLLQCLLVCNVEEYCKIVVVSHGASCHRFAQYTAQL